MNIFGGHKSGKSSVIRYLLNEDAPTECTVGLSYSYYRSNGAKNFNLWEIGGELNVSGRNMALVPLEHSTNVVLVLLLDLATLSCSNYVFRRLCCSISHSRSQKISLTYYFHQNRPLKIGRIVVLD